MERGFLSPVNDAYKKAGLIESKHRIEMCKRAVASNDWLQVDTWESEQDSYVTTVRALRHFDELLNGGAAASSAPTQVKLLCGADLLETLVKPDVWDPADVRFSVLVLHGADRQ